ncbi:ankyrin repeat protein [Ophiostoma piceae UAMH 11346]|uniref:Ankyrin repeat protein n=1 Tax=Ophiostoma piceae (strain UAMH 11346) TaxID=1262450 RepID=S3D7W7_OPHP1|nr:ankyrin repeat protein [Ophiostoma piceae UAMH 11346]
MSFGVGVGDLLAIISLANKIRKDFLGAPADFKSITDEVRNVSIVLQDVSVFLDGLSDDQETTILNLVQSCRGVLEDLATIIDKNSEVAADSLGNGGEQIAGHKTTNKNFSSLVKRSWKRIKWDSKEIGALRDRLISNISALNASITIVTNQNTVAVKGGVDRLNQHQDDHARAAILDWLTPIDYGAQQTDFIARRQDGTGQWFLESPELQDWLQGDKQTLFCPGIPGAGKTILTSVVVNELSTRFENDRTIGIAYVYCNFRRKHEQKTMDLIASLLKQLSRGQPSVPDCVKALHHKHQSRETRPSLDEMAQALQVVARMYSRTFVIVDALDECQTTDGCRSRLIAEIFNLQAKCGSSIFATSRFIPEITAKFDVGTSLEIRASKADIARFLEGNISKLSASEDWSAELKDLIKTSISDVVDGMFLLAQLYLQALNDKTKPRAVKKALLELRRQGPGSSESQKKDILDLAYDDAMRRIQEQGPGFRDLAIQVISWITCAQRPLTTLELQHALAVEPGESDLDPDNFDTVERMISVCVGLVTVDPESSIIRLVHYTTQEYFDRTQDQWFPNVQSQLATICTTYLSFDAFCCGPCASDDELEHRLEFYPLLHYAALNWGHHARKAVVFDRSIVEFLQIPGAVKAASELLAYFWVMFSENDFVRIEPESTTGLHLAVYSSVDKAITALLQNGADANSQDSNGETPLLHAAMLGHHTVVKLLLDTPNVMPDLKGERGRTPLSYAAEYGHEAVVKLLLDNDKTMPDSKGEWDRTPLSYAAEGGHDAIVKRLLDTGKVMLNSKGEWDRTPLLYAVENGHKAVVKLLLDTGKVMHDSKGQWDSTPLIYAAANGHEDVVRLILDTYKVTPDSKEQWDRTPHGYAVEHGHDAIAKLLLDTYNAMPDSKDQSDRASSEHNVENEHDAAVELSGQVALG